MTTLPEPDFIHRDAARVLRECIEFVESDETGLGRPLLPSQVERVLVDLIVYREMVLRHQVQEAAKQNLVAFARYPMIDHLTQLIGASRLAATPASAPFEFVFEAPLEEPLPVPQGTRVRSSDGKVDFQTVEAATLDVGLETATLTLQCTEIGRIGNGYGPGQVSNLLDSLAVAVTVSNTETTAGGSESEDTERLRTRFPLAVRSLSTAGPTSAYEFFARAAHPDVLDVAVTRPEPGVARVSVLSSVGDGVPTEPVLDAVEAALDDEDVRPLCDTVQVVAATPVDWALTAELTLTRDRVGTIETAASLAAANTRAQAFVDALQQELGRSLVLSQVYAALSGSDVYQVDLPGLVGIEVEDYEWLRCTAVDVSVVGYEGVE